MLWKLNDKQKVECQNISHCYGYSVLASDYFYIYIFVINSLRPSDAYMRQ